MVTNKTHLDRCSWFINKVREDRYGKVKDRQVRKFHNLFNKSKNNNNRLGQVSNGSNLEMPNNNSSNNNNTSQWHDNNNKWVINLSKTRLTEGQMSVLAKGPNFAITPKYIPNVDYITAVEPMCSKLNEEDAMELRSNISALLRKSKAPKPNLTREENIGIAQLKKDKDKVILTMTREWPW